MRLSYAITVCNELEEIQNLLTHLLKNKREEDEIVVLLDEPKATQQIQTILDGHEHSGNITLIKEEFKNKFADWKNLLTSCCTGDYIVNIDADEIPSELFQESIIDVLTDNPEVDVFIVPRYNTVKGLTDDHIKRWRWNVDEFGRVNWPDYQMRVYKNIDTIEWIGSVHEVLTGYNTFAPLPDHMYFHHHKTIEKQEKQNNFYNKL